MSWLKAATWLAGLTATATIDPARCTRRHEAGCSVCTAACPKQAIELGDRTATVDSAACVGCGLCVPACPVGAIDGVGPHAAVVADEIALGATVRCDPTRVLGDPGEGRCIDVPCLGVIHPETLAAGAVRAGMATVRTGPCEQCPVGAAEQVTDQIRAAGRIVAAGGSPVRIHHERVEPRATTDAGSAAEAATREPARSRVRRPRRAVSRRGLLGLGVPPADDPRPESASGPQPAPDATPRDLLLAATGGAALPRVSSAPGCTGCEACVKTCPTGALGYAAGSLTFNARECVGCSECVRICPENVLDLQPHGPGPSLTVIAQVPVRTCERCGGQLGPGERESLCHRCGVRQSLVADVWKQLG